MYKGSFIEFVENAGCKYYVGIGNPKADILIIGKEPNITEPASLDEYQKNAFFWKYKTDNNVAEVLEYLVTRDHPLYKSWGKNTWSRYQTLMDKVRENKTPRYYVDFLKDVFTTELNDLPSKNTASANKTGIGNHKQLFKESAFIQDFKVIILACSNYIKNDETNREIDDIFGVRYDGDETGRYFYSNTNWFYTHHNTSGDKLVIHTRQLSANVRNELLNDMATIVREHLKKQNIKLTHEQ